MWLFLIRTFHFRLNFDTYILRNWLILIDQYFQNIFSIYFTANVCVGFPVLNLRYFNPAFVWIVCILFSWNSWECLMTMSLIHPLTYSKAFQNSLIHTLVPKKMLKRVIMSCLTSRHFTWRNLIIRGVSGLERSKI